MENIKITFLGTGSAIPTKNRNHTAILLTYKSENILVDCGEGTQRQFKISGISPSKITKILLTHNHGDHIFGLPGLFQTLAMSDYHRTLEIYGPRGTKSLISSIESLIKKIPIKISVKEVSSSVVSSNDFEIEAKEMNHTVLSLAYSFKIKDKRRLIKSKLSKFGLPNSPILKQLQEGKKIKFKNKTILPNQVSQIEKGKKVTFILDTLPNQNAITLAKSSDLLICESSFSELESEIAKTHKHLTSKDAATIAKKAKVKSLILTHISQRYDKNPKQIEDEAKKIFKSVSLAKDFLEIQI